VDTVNARMFARCISTCFLLTACGLWMPAQNRNAPMTQADSHDELSGDLVPFVSQADVSMVVAQIQNSRLARTVYQGLEEDSGPVALKVLNVLHGGKPAVGETITVFAHRIADPLVRVRNLFDQWNGLSLRDGDFLIFGLRQSPNAGAWVPLAARQVAGPEAGESAALRQCYAIESVPFDTAQKSALLQEALKSREDLLFRYSVESVRRMAVHDRAAAVDLLFVAVSDPGLSSEERFDAGRALTEQIFFRRDAKADGANRTAVAALAKGLVLESDPQKRVDWAQLLSSCVMMSFTGDATRDDRLRRELIRGTGTPSSQVVSALDHALSHSASDARQRIESLRQLWATP
jgi:hypothetical protein